jgi:hypothetical protein
VLAGKLLISTAAFARVKVDEKGSMGDTVTDTDGSIDLKVHIEAIPEIDVTLFMVFVNCDEAMTVDATAPDALVKYDGTLQVPVTVDSHVEVLGFGGKDMPLGFTNYNAMDVPRFVTNPVFIDADGDGRYTAPGAKTCTYHRPGH